MRKYLATILTVLMFCAMSFTAYATEAEEASAFKCNVSFYITDETGDYPGSSFTANMTDKTGTITDSYKFTKGNSWGGANTPKYTMIAPTTYTVTFEGLEDGYKVVSTLDRAEIITFDTFSEGTADVLWSIVKEEEITAISESAGSAILEQNKDGNYIASDKGAEEVYKNFLEATVFIADDTNWKNNLLQSYELFPHEERYASYVEGGTEEEYLSMSLYDRFVWSETYLKFAWAVNSGNYDNYYGSEENFASHITNDVVNMMKGVSNSEGVIEAYLALADWQYQYVKANGVPFNFINNRSYLDEVAESPKKEETKKNNEEIKKSEEEIKKSDEKELSEAAKELLEDADDKTKKGVKKKGVWDDTLDALARHILTIVVILILCVAVVFVVWKRRRLNMNDDKDGDTSVDNTHDK